MKAKIKPIKLKTITPKQLLTIEQRIKISTNEKKKM